MEAQRTPTAGARPDIRFYQPGDGEGLVRLWQQTFDQWPAARISVDAVEHLRWKLECHPAASRCQVVATAGATVVGTLFFLVQRFSVAGRGMLTLQGMDWCIDPGYQRAGLMTAMRAFAWPHLERAFDFNFGTSGHPAVPELHRRTGYEHLANRPQRFSLDLEDAAERSFATAGGSPVGGGDTRIVEAARFDGRIDDFCDAASKSYDLIPVRDQRYLNWRYCDPRGGLSLIRLAEEDGRVLGYAALRPPPGRGTGYIADLLALPGRSDVAELLARNAVALYREKGAAKVECWLPARHAYTGALERLGFARAGRDRQFMYAPLRAQPEELTVLRDPDAAVHFTIGDTDFV